MTTPGPAPDPDPEPDEHSSWEGMSGAAVWASGRLIGVVGQDHPGEGLGTLTVCPVEQLFGCASATKLEAWRTALPQLPTTAGNLWLATPPTVRNIEVARARRALEALAPPALIGRSAELAALEDFIGSGARWRWIQGDAYAGKTARGIPVTNSPGKNAQAVAEFTLTFALMLIRGVPASARFLLDGGRRADSPFEGGRFMGGEAASMTLGLVGLGHVGRAVAVRARALGFTVLAHDPALPGTVPAGVSLVGFDDLLARSDIVSLHARVTEGNRHLFGAAAFARMPRGS
jgi:hypothetical protein